MCHSKRKDIPSGDGEQWDDSRNDALMRKLNVDFDGIGISEAQFIDYFLTEWNAGLELFTDEDFDNAIWTFLQVGMESEVKEGVRPATERDAAAVVFNAADTNCDNSLDAEELTEFLKGRPKLEASLLENRTVDDLFKSLDQNSDGKISLEEFQEIFTLFMEEAVEEQVVQAVVKTESKTTVKKTTAASSKTAKENSKKSKSPKSSPAAKSPKSSKKAEASKEKEVTTVTTVTEETVTEEPMPVEKATPQDAAVLPDGSKAKRKNCAGCVIS